MLNVVIAGSILFEVPEESVEVCMKAEAKYTLYAFLHPGLNRVLRCNKYFLQPHCKATLKNDGHKKAADLCD